MTTILTFKGYSYDIDEPRDIASLILDQVTNAVDADEVVALMHWVKDDPRQSILESTAHVGDASRATIAELFKFSAADLKPYIPKSPVEIYRANRDEAYNALVELTGAQPGYDLATVQMIGNDFSRNRTVLEISMQCLTAECCRMLAEIGGFNRDSYLRPFQTLEQTFGDANPDQRATLNALYQVQQRIGNSIGNLPIDPDLIEAADASEPDLL